MFTNKLYFPLLLPFLPFKPNQTISNNVKKKDKSRKTSTFHRFSPFFFKSKSPFPASPSYMLPSKKSIPFPRKKNPLVIPGIVHPHVRPCKKKEINNIGADLSASTSSPSFTFNLGAGSLQAATLERA